ncbi:helix-turn-helix transcriptional regulator [Nocardiaceae bacterium NPDC056970]
MMDPEQLVADLRRQKARETAARIAYLRRLRQLHERGYTQVDLAKLVGVSQPTISDMLRRARVDAPDVRPGTHGGTPYEICARYAAGEIDRAVALRELTDWRYARPAEPNPFEWANDGAPVTEGSFNLQIGRALRNSFLTDQDYDALLDALADT